MEEGGRMDCTRVLVLASTGHANGAHARAWNAAVRAISFGRRTMRCS